MSDQKTIDEVLAAEEARRKALLSADTGALEKMLTAGYVYIHGGGRVEPRAEYIAALGSGKFRFTAFSSQNVDVTLIGDAALVAGEIFVTREEAGVSKVTHFRFASVWAREQGGWKLAFWQNTVKA